MKKGLKITGIAVASLLLLLFLLPFAFSGKIKQAVVTKGNEMLNAHFDFRSIDLSLLRNFPRATVSVKDFYIKGVGQFEQDTLASADKISITIDVMSLFGSQGYDVRSVLVSNANVKAIVLEDGTVNWDVMKPDSTTAGQSSEASAFHVKLRRITLENCNIIYDDREGKMSAQVSGLSAKMSGDMTADRTLLKIEADVPKLGFVYNGIPYLKNAVVNAQMDIEADLEKMAFVFKDNHLQLNNIRTSLDGRFAMPEAGYDMDLKLVTEKIDFKDILSLVPAIYASDFKGVVATGAVSLNAWVKGLMTDEVMPAFEVSLKVDNGQFSYPSLPKSVDNVNIAAVITNPGGTADATIIDVKPMAFTMAGNPFSVNLHLSTPVSDPAFDLKAHGVLNLGMVKDVYPLDGTELNGVVDANVAINGRMSYIEKEQYDLVAASGTLGFTNMVVKMADMPNVNIKKSLFTFTPRYLNLSETAVTIGKSDITADCRLENYIAYALKDKTLKGVLNMRSNLLDLNELTGNTTAQTPAAESAPMEAFAIPKNIDFDVKTTLNKVLFSNMTLDNVVGQVVVSGGKLDMRNLAFNSLGGSVVANGSYSTVASVNAPQVDAKFKMSGVSFEQTFATFNTVRQLAPIFEGLKGNFSGNIAMNTTLDKALNPDLKTLSANGSVSTSNLNLSGVATLDQIADALKYPKLKNIDIHDLKIDFEVKQGRIYTKPFEIKTAEAKLLLNGSTGIDKTIDYTGRVTLPQAVGGIANISTLDLKIGGTFSSPKVTVDTKAMVNQIVNNIAGSVVGNLGDKIGLNLASAQAQKETLVANAQKAGDELVAQAQKQVDALVSNAKDPFAKAGAKLAGDKLMKEARKQSASLVASATAEGDKLIDKANGGAK